MRRRNPHHQPHNRPPDQYLYHQSPKRTPAPVHTIPYTHPLHLLTTQKLNIRTLYRVNILIPRNSISTREFFLTRNNTLRISHTSRILNTLRLLHVLWLTNIFRSLNIARILYIFRLSYIFRIQNLNLATGYTRITKKLFSQKKEHHRSLH